ncbi:MAG: tetratricopeptide repeat protein [Deltaproteobacteria bacterium]|nr:tetratricopeptide repeat protein [Deltaproteobacteria bacterium]
MNFIFLILLLFIPNFSFAQSAPATSSATSGNEKAILTNYDDYDYYKKNGRTSKAWNDLVKDGFESYNKRDCEKTIAYLKEAIKAGCSDPIVNFKLAACSEATGSLYSALQYYRESETGLKILKTPHRYQQDFYESIGRVLLFNKKTDEALPYLTRAAEVGTPSFVLYYILGELSLSKKDPGKALEYFTKASQLPLDGATPAQLTKIYKMMGNSYLEAKDWKNALEYLNKALQQSPTDPELQQAQYRANEMKRQDELMNFMEKMKKESE